MKRRWYRRDREAAQAALRRGQRPDWAATMACGPLDELVALHEELGIYGALDRPRPHRQRAGIDDDLLRRQLSCSPA